ncbi:MAG: hypothetical protein ACJ797_29200 [Ktedonobacteraceae bacterium]
MVEPCPMTWEWVDFVVEDEHQVTQRSFPFVPQGFGSRAQDDRGQEFRFLSISADKSAVGTINRPLQRFHGLGGIPLLVS